MAKGISFLLFSSLLLLISSCKQKEVMVPSYVYLSPAQLITKSDGSQGYASAKTEDLYVFSNGETRGIIAANSTIPLQNIGKTNIRISPGIKYNGMAEQRAIYPMFKYFEKDYDLKAGVVDTIKTVFNYVENTVFPLIEDFDGGGLSFEYNPAFKQIGDSLIKDNSSNAWMPGRNSGKVVLNSGVAGSFLEVYSRVFSNWPRFTPFYLEMDYKGNIPITVGLYATDAQLTTSRFAMFILNPKTGWNKLYLDLEPEINKRGANMQYRVFLSFNKGDVVNPEAWIDNLKVVYLD